VLACAGQEAVAYAQLRDLEERQPANPDLCLRLYWLLALLPELDPGQTPVAWLTRGLLANRSSSPLWELYRRELDANPEEALSDRCGRLVGGAMPGRSLTDILELRWRAAAKLGMEIGTIQEDLESARGRGNWQGEAWLRLLMRAVERLEWSESDQAAALIGQCRSEIEQLAPTHWHLRAELDRLDELGELCRGLQALKAEPDMPPELLTLVPLSWEKALDDYRPVLMKFLGSVADAPLPNLALFDRIRRLSQAVLNQLGRVLGELQQRLPAPEGSSPEHMLIEPLLEFVDQCRWRDYDLFRTALLPYCLHEVLAPEWVGQVLAHQPAYWLSDTSHLSQRILDDWSLRYVWLAHRVFWA
jgi:hypothetical protein